MSEYWNTVMVTAKAIRHDLHAHPEIAWEEKRTAQTVRDRLDSWGIPWQPCAGTGTLARLNPAASGTHIALRGDIDALPITEDTGKQWCSQHQGYMHACGHDGHTATLLASAQWLKHCESALPGPVTLLFQPAEEGGHGAERMIQQGALQGIDEIYGWHNWPAIPFGQLACPDGIVMCGNGTFILEIKGVGGHASQPELCRDPVLAASAITLALQQIVSRRLAPQRTAVVSVTSIDAISSSTVIPAKAVLQGSLRVPDSATRQEVNQLITEISQQTARSYGVECEVSIQPRYEATINHRQQAERVRRLWLEDSAEQKLADNTALPIMASEDFSYYLNQIPGAFALIGSDDGQDHPHPCHSPHYDFNDRLIAKVTRLYARLVGAPVPEREESNT